MLQLLAPLLAPIIGKLVDRIPDAAARERARAEAEKAITDALLEASRQQTEINRIEAASPNLFVSGWRPFIGWVCGAGLGWAFLGRPLADWLVAALGLPVTPPDLPTDGLFELVLAMLGLGGLRSFEKLKGVARA